MTPRKKRAAKNPFVSCKRPDSVVTMPQASVSVGNQNRGVVLLRTMLHGIWFPSSALGPWQVVP